MMEGETMFCGWEGDDVDGGAILVRAICIPKTQHLTQVHTEPFIVDNESRCGVGVEWSGCRRHDYTVSY